MPLNSCYIARFQFYAMDLIEDSVFLVPVFVPLCFVSASCNRLTQGRDNGRSQRQAFVVMMIFCERFLSLTAPEHFSAVCPVLKLDIKS